MNKIKKRLKKSNGFFRSLYFLILIAYIVSFIFFAKSIIALKGIETIIRYVMLIILIVFYLLYMIICYRKLIKRKYVVISLLSIMCLICIVVFSFSSYFIDMIFSKLEGFSETDKVTYTSYLITLSDTTLNSNSIIGMVDDKNDIEGYVIPNEIIKDNKLKYEIKEYDSSLANAYLEMIYDLYDKKVDGIFISSNYVTLYSTEDNLDNIKLETKIIYQKSKEFKNADVKIESNKSLNEPFTALILGVDSEVNGLNANAAFNGDTLILATFNPDTYSATLLSFPRDIYVPIACRKGNYAKINSSAASGTSCVIETIENLIDIPIDYYVKINFKGVVELVEAVGGINVNVEEPNYRINHGNNCGEMVCEQNSNREWGSKTIYINPGMQFLNGEEALAYSRNRGQYIEGDIARNRHQQDVIMAIASEIVKLESYTEFKNIVSAISNNFVTNMSIDNILSSYKILKGMLGNVLKDEDFISISRAKLETYSLPVYLPTSGTYTSALGYYESSLEDIIHEMKTNLEIENPETIKTFSYYLGEEYEPKVAGKGLRSGSTNSVLESFVQKNRTEAEEYCNSNNLSCHFIYVDGESEYYNDQIETDLITYQNPHQGTLLKNVDNITFYINGAE